MNQKANYIFSEKDLDWKRLDSIGISRKQLEEDGSLDLLLQGKETGLVPIHLNTPSINFTLAATLRLVTNEDGNTIVEINGIAPIQY